MQFISMELFKNILSSELGLCCYKLQQQKIPKNAL